jgi:hypothetical protein
MGQVVSKMNAEVKELWLKELRNPERKQARGALRKPDGECCLGVLCDIAVKNNVIPEPKFDGGMGVYYFDNDGYGPEGGVLPVVVQRWAGVDSSLPGVHRDGILFGLAGLNDGGATFAEIADLIEEQL